MENLNETRRNRKFDPTKYPATGPKYGTRAWRKWSRWRYEQNQKACARWREVLGIGPGEEVYCSLPYDFVVTGIWTDDDERWLQALGRWYRARRLHS